jgi:hypothetical protein
METRLDPGPHDYPLSSEYRLLEGHDIVRTRDAIAAIVAVEGPFGKDIRLYRWQRRESGWKVDLARFSVKSWDFAVIAQKTDEWKKRFGVRS